MKGKVKYQDGGSTVQKPSAKESDGGRKLFGEGILFERMPDSDTDIIPGLLRGSRKKFKDESENGMKIGGMTKKSGRDGCAIRGRTRG